MTRQYLFQILFFVSKEGFQNGLLISMTYLFSPICIFFKYKFFRVLSLSINIYTPKYYVTKKEPAMFCSANFPRLRRKFHSNSKQFSVAQTGRDNKLKKTNKTQQKINIYVSAFVSQKGKTERKMS